MSDDKLPDDKFTYKEGDLKTVKEGTGPTLGEIMEERRKRAEIESDPEFGRPDPGFRAPRPPK